MAVFLEALGASRRGSQWGGGTRGQTRNSVTVPEVLHDEVEMQHAQQSAADAFLFAQANESDRPTQLANQALRPYSTAIEAVYADSIHSERSVWEFIKRLFFENFNPGKLKIGRTATFSLDKQKIIAACVKLIFSIGSIALFAYLLSVMLAGYKQPSVNVVYELEPDGFELPMVAMCGEMLNFRGFSANVNASEVEANDSNNIGVERFLGPQSLEGLPAYAAAAQNLVPDTLIYSADGTACIQTDNVATSIFDSQVAADKNLRRQQNVFFSKFLKSAIAPFYPFLQFDSDSYVNTPSCVV